MSLGNGTNRDTFQSPPPWRWAVLVGAAALAYFAFTLALEYYLYFMILLAAVALLLFFSLAAAIAERWRAVLERAKSVLPNWSWVRDLLTSPSGPPAQSLRVAYVDTGPIRRVSTDLAHAVDQLQLWLGNQSPDHRFTLRDIPIETLNVSPADLSLALGTLVGAGRLRMFYEVRPPSVPRDDLRKSIPGFTRFDSIQKIPQAIRRNAEIVPVFEEVFR